MTVAICQIGTASDVAFALHRKRVSQPQTERLARQVPSEASDHLKSRRKGHRSKPPPPPPSVTDESHPKKHEGKSPNTTSCATTSSCFLGRVELSAPPAVQLSASSWFPSPRQRDVIRRSCNADTLPLLLLCRSESDCVPALLWEAWRRDARWQPPLPNSIITPPCADAELWCGLTSTGEDDTLALKKKVTVEDLFGPDLQIHDPDAKWLSGEETHHKSHVVQILADCV